MIFFDVELLNESFSVKPGDVFSFSSFGDGKSIIAECFREGGILASGINPDDNLITRVYGRQHYCVSFPAILHTQVWRHCNLDRVVDLAKVFSKKRFYRAKKVTIL